MHSKLYIRLMNSREWRETRAKKLLANPLCERCAMQGYVVAASVVHHITEVESAHSEREARQLCFNFRNLQSLCRECHRDIHAEQRSHSRAAHKQREADRLTQWIARHGKAEGK